MAIARLSGQDASGTSATTSAVATYPGTPTQGNLLIAVVYANIGIGNTTVSGWTQRVESACGSTAASGSVGIYFKVAGAAESTTVTANATGASQMRVQVYEYSGVTSTTDGTSLDNTGATSVTTFHAAAVGQLVTTNADDLLIAGWGFNGNTSAPSVDSSFTLLTQNPRLVSANRIVSATGTYTPSLTWTTAVRTGGLLAAFKSAAVPATVAAVVAVASAVGLAPTVTGQTNVSPPIAATTAQAPAPALSAGATIAAVTAPAAAQAEVPDVTAGVAAAVDAVMATGTALALAPAVAGAATMESPTAAASDVFLSPTVSAGGTFTGVIATATAAGATPAVTAAAQVDATTATATAAAAAPSVGSAAQVLAVTAHATAAARVPRVFVAIHYEAPDDRLLVVSAEDRFLTVKAEDRYLTVPAENRYMEA